MTRYMSYIKRRSNETNDLQQELPDLVKDVVKELTKRQVAILDMILNNPFLSAKAISEKISEKFAVTDRTIENDLAHLKKYLTKRFLLEISIHLHTYRAIP